MLFQREKAPARRWVFNTTFCIGCAVVIYIVITHTEIEFPNCRSTSDVTSSTLVPQIRPDRPYSTYIISAVPKRRNFTENSFKARLPNFFNVTHRSSVPLNDSRIYTTAGVTAASLMLTYIDLWRDIALKPDSEIAPNDWIFIFEDDVDIVPLGILETFYYPIYEAWNRTDPCQSLADVIEKGLKLAKQEGIMYLGTCGPEYVDNTTTMQNSSNGLIQYRRGIYFCTHAVAYTKWRLRTLWNDLAVYNFQHSEVGSDTIARQWQALSKTYPISVGANVEWPLETGHYGFFYQARGIFQSTIQD